MSKLSDYSKFDHLDTDSEEEEQVRATTSVSQAPPQQSVAPGRNPADEEMQRDPVTKRFVFSYQKQRIYEWEQSLTEVMLYVPAPPPIIKEPSSAKHLVDCQFSAYHLKLGLKFAESTPTKYYLNEDTGGLVDTEESTWCLEDVETNQKTKELMLVLYLQKGNKGAVWNCVLKGPSLKLNPVDLEEVQKEILLQRYGEENPGFDFSGASVNGSVPDPRSFMGGVSYS